MKNKIIDSIIKDDYYKKVCFSLCNGKYYHQDLYQIIILKLLEISEEKLIIINCGNLKGYVNRMILNEYKNRYSQFNREIKDSGEDLSGNIDLEDEEYLGLDDIKIESVKRVLKEEEDYWNQRGQPPWTILLFEQFKEKKSIRELSRHTNIPYPTIRYNIDRLIQLINEDFNNNRQ